MCFSEEGGMMGLLAQVFTVVYLHVSIVHMDMCVECVHIKLSLCLLSNQVCSGGVEESGTLVLGGQDTLCGWRVCLVQDSPHISIFIYF